MDGRNTRWKPVFAALFLAACSLLPSHLSADTPEERVRKFQGSLGEQVVRDSGQPLAEGERTAVLKRAALFALGGGALLAGISVLLARLRSRRASRETAYRYLTENLMTPEAIRTHLATIVEMRTPLHVWIDDHFIKFSSRADELPRGEDAIAVQPLAPSAGNDMLRGAGRVRVEYLHQKVPYHFDTTRKGERTERGGFHHLFHLPGRIHFIQRREYYRVEPSLSAPLECLVTGRDLTPLSVLDIGMEGFAVATSSKFRLGEEIGRGKIVGREILPVEISARCVYEYPLSESASKYRYRYGFLISRFTEGGGKRLARYMSKQQLLDLSRRKAMES